MNEQHTNYRDEQFWFTAAVVTFNTVLVGKDIACIPKCSLVFASALVSLLGAIIILTRWVADARTHADIVRAEQDKKGSKSHPSRESGRFKHFPKEAPNPEFASVWKRFYYFLVELSTGLQAVPYIVVEGSGSLFYLLLIGLTFLAVCLYA